MNYERKRGNTLRDESKMVGLRINWNSHQNNLNVIFKLMGFILGSLKVTDLEIKLKGRRFFFIASLYCHQVLLKN